MVYMQSDSPFNPTMGGDIPNTMHEVMEGADAPSNTGVAPYDEDDMKQLDQTKLTDWVNEPSVWDLQQEFELSLPSRDLHKGRVLNWRDMYHCRNAYSGQTLENEDRERSVIQPKVIATQVEWRCASLAEPFHSTEDLFQVNPSNAQSIDSAIQQTKILNWQFSTQLDRTLLIDTLVRNLCIDGTAVLKCGWDSQVIKRTVKVPEFVLNNPSPTDTDLVQILQRCLAIKQADPDVFENTADPASKIMVEYYEQTGQLVSPRQVGLKDQIEEQLVRNVPMVEVCLSENMYVDPSCEGDIEKANFVARTFATSRGWLEASGINYQNLDDVPWEGGDVRGDPYYYDVADQTYRANDPTRHKCVAYEYWGKWDIHNDGTLVPIVATWVGDTMIRMEENPYPDGKPPFVFIRYTPRQFEVYGEPDAELTIDNQRTVGAVQRGLIDILAKSAAGQRGVSKDALDDINFDRFQAGNDFMFNPGQNPTQQIITMGYPQLSPSAIEMIQLQKNEAEALSGVRPFQGSLDSPNASAVQRAGLGTIDAAGIREASIMNRIASGFQQIGRKIVSMNEVFLTSDDVIQITHDSFVPVDTGKLSGAFNLKVNVQTQAQNAAQASDLVFLLQTTAPNMPPEMTKALMMKVAQLKGLADLAKMMEDYQPQPDPNQVALEQSKVALNQSHAAKNQATAQKAQVEAQHKAIQTQQLATGQETQAKMNELNLKAQHQQQLAITNGLMKHRNAGTVAPDVANAVSFSQAANQDNQTNG